MILPTTSATAVLLCLLAFVCLGLWVVTLSLQGPRWRFELFTIDFAFGALCCSLVTALTFGTMGPELAFSDRFLVASHTAEAFVLGGGLCFGVANIFFVGSTYLVGLSRTIPVIAGLAGLVLIGFEFQANPIGAPLAAALLAVGIYLGLANLRARRSPRSTMKPGARAKRTAMLSTTKATIMSVLAGVLFSCAYLLCANGIFGELGVGAYGGLVLFCAAALLSTLGFDLLLFNLPIEGGRLPFGAYFGLPIRRHMAGLTAGSTWAMGALSALLVRGMPVLSTEVQVLNNLCLAGAFILAMLWAVSRGQDTSKVNGLSSVSPLRAGIPVAAGLILYGWTAL